MHVTLEETRGKVVVRGAVVQRREAFVSSPSGRDARD